MLPHTIIALLTSILTLHPSSATPVPHLAPPWLTCDTSAPALLTPLNVSTPLNTISSLGPYSPYIPQNSSYCRNAPDGFIIDQVTILSRHGARSPTASAGKKIVEAVKAAKNTTGPIVDPAHQFIADYKFEGFTADVLTDYGRKQLYDSGVRYAAEYSSLAGNYFIRSAGEQRVVESSGYFLQGFYGQPFQIINATTLHHPAVIIPEDVNTNNTLNVNTCPTFEAYEPDLGDLAQANFLKFYATPITTRLNSLLPGANLTNSQTQQLMSLCGFEAVKGLKYAESEWCRIFEDEEWAGLEYGYDVSKFYGHGIGNPYSKALYSGYVNEIIARLTGKPVLLGGATNSTLDSSDATFPLDKSFYADFSQRVDNDMTAIAAAFGLLQEPILPTKINASSIPDHKYVVSKVVPFAGRFVFERLVSPDGTRYVRILINDAVQALTFPGCGHYGYHGLCNVDAFIAAQSYATTTPPHWDSLCYSAQTNATVA